MGNAPGTETLGASLRERTESDAVPSLSVAVVKGGRTVWARAFGYADLAGSVPATSETAYLWFSMTKIATATAIVRLAETGELDLDAPVTDYFPGFAIVSQPVQVSTRHLLGHSSGLANPLPIRWVRPASAPPPDRQTFLGRLLARHRRLRFDPGERAAYSNLGYLVLGEVVQSVSGVGYEEYVRREILEPLGMERTGFAYHGAAEDGAATGYQPLRRPLGPLLRAALPRGVVGSRQGRYVSFNPFYVNGPAYGGLVGSAEEAVRLAALHLSGGQVGGVRVLAEGSVAEMRRIVPKGGKRDFGLGWYRSHGAQEERGRVFVEHLGGGAGFWNVMRIYPEEALGIVLMGNATSYDHESILEDVTRAGWT